MKLNAGGGYMLEASSFCLEVLSEEEIDTLIKYIIREHEVEYKGWNKKYIKIDGILSDFYLSFADDKLEEYMQRIAACPLQFNAEEQESYEGMWKALKKSIEPYTTWEQKQEEFREKTKSERRLRGMFRSAAFSTDPEVAERLAREAETEEERDFYNCVLNIHRSLKGKKEQ